MKTVDPDAPIGTIPPYNPNNPHAVLNPGQFVFARRENMGETPPIDPTSLVVLPPTEPPVEPEVPEPPVFEGDWNTEVRSGGTTAVNGVYFYVNPEKWQKGAYTIEKVPYPDPESLSWGIINGASVYYWGEEATLPWEAVWHLASFGIAPSPTVTSKRPT